MKRKKKISDKLKPMHLESDININTLKVSNPGALIFLLLLAAISEASERDREEKTSSLHKSQKDHD